MALPKYAGLFATIVLVSALALGACSSADTGGAAGGAVADSAGGTGGAGGADVVSDVNSGGQTGETDGIVAEDDVPVTADDGVDSPVDAEGTGSEDAGIATDGGVAADGGTSTGDTVVESEDIGGAIEPDAVGPQEPSQAGYPGSEMMIKIASPGGGLGAQVIGAKTTVAGLLFGDADEITWTASSGVEGEIFPGAFWITGPIDLDEGDNVITVTSKLGDEIATDTITITYNPLFRFDARPLARPNIVWAGASTPVVFTIPVSLYPNFDEETVTLVEVDAAGVESANLGQMKDNGQTAAIGDEIESDGVFTKKVTINCSGSSHKYFRVAVQARKGVEWYTAYSPTIPVYCLEHYKPAECQDDLGVLQQADQLAQTGAPTEAVVQALLDSELVTDAGPAGGDGHSVWVQFETGVLGAVLLAPDGTRGSGSPYDDPFVGGMTPTAVTGPNVVELGSKKALVLAPFAAEFGITDDAPDVAAALAVSECPSFALAGGAMLQGAAASLDRFREFNIYGVVSVSTHGEALFDGMDPDVMRELYGWDHVRNQEVIWSGEQVQCSQLLQNNQSCTVSSSNASGGCPSGTVCLVTSGSGGSTSSGLCLDRTQVDLRLGRLVLTNRGYAMTPSFFEAYAGRGHPNSLVNLGACRTMYNGTLVGSLFAHGVKAVTGFSGYVQSAFAKEQVKSLFEGAVGQGQIGLYYTPAEDPANPGSRWRLFGATTLDLSTADIINASFETGDTTGWSQQGDGRVITKLGSTGPVEGKFMGLLSTGLGFTVQMGTLEQEFCIPEDKAEMQIYWKFFSEEFEEYCGSQFQDTFLAEVIGSGGKLTVVNTKVDDLCFYSHGSCSTCLNPTGCDFECMGSEGCEWDESTATCTGEYPCQCGKFFVGLQPSDVGFDQGDVLNTFWQKTVKNVTALAGTGKVTLRLFTSDTGDSIFDTVVLVDDIEFR